MAKRSCAEGVRRLASVNRTPGSTTQLVTFRVPLDLDCPCGRVSTASLRARPINEALTLGLGRAVPLGQGDARRRWPQAGPQPLLDDGKSWRRPLATHGVAVEVGVEPDVLRPAFAATEAAVRIPPVGRPPATAEDIERLADRDGAVVAAVKALDDKVSVFAAQILQRSDNACHTASRRSECIERQEQAVNKLVDHVHRWHARVNGCCPLDAVRRDDGADRRCAIFTG